MNIRALETLVQILTVESFSEVAEMRNMTLSAVSMQMKSLEHELDVELFDRQCRPPRLTPLGRKIAQQAQLILGERDSLTKMCQNSQELRGVYLLGFIQTASVRVLPKFLLIATQRAPNAAFQFTSGLSEDLSTQVAEGKLDAAVVTQVAEQAEGLNIQTLVEEELVIAVPQAYRHCDLASLQQQLKFIRFRPTTGIGRLVSSAIKDRENPPTNQLILNSIEGTLECVKLGLGFTVLPKPDVSRYRDERIATIASSGLFPNRHLALVTRSDRQTEHWRAYLFNLLREAI